MQAKANEIATIEAAIAQAIRDAGFDPEVVKADIAALVAKLAEAQRVADGPKTVRVILETEGWFDKRKHGHAYVALLEVKEGKVTRNFLRPARRIWDSRRKSYMARWEFDAPVGARIEARLDEGSWKNERRSYFEVTPQGLKAINRLEALEW
jgi:hypothetical protein